MNAGRSATVHLAVALLLSMLAVLAAKAAAFAAFAAFPRTFAWTAALVWAGIAAALLRRPSARATTVRRAALSVGAAAAVMVVHAVVAPWPYELAGAARVTPVPEGGELVLVTTWGIDPPLPFQIDNKHRAYLEYAYAPATNVTALAREAALALEADGWRVGDVDERTEIAHHGRGERTVPPTPVPVAEVDGARGGLRSSVLIGRWEPVCCQFSTDPETPVRLRLMVEDPRTSGV